MAEKTESIPETLQKAIEASTRLVDEADKLMENPGQTYREIITNLALASAKYSRATWAMSVVIALQQHATEEST